MNPALIILAAAFTGATSYSLGLLLLHWLKPRLRAGEVFPLAFVLGSAVLSLSVFAALTLWIAKPWAFALIGIAAIGTCLHRRAWRIPVEPSPALPSRWKWLMVGSLTVYGFYTFIHALAPEVSADGIAYHLGVIVRYLREGGFFWYTTNMYANLPMGVEMLFAYAFSFGKHSAAALVHWQFLMVFPFVLLAIGRRFDLPRTGAIAGLITFLAPVVLIDGAIAYVDVGAAVVTTTLFLALVAFEQDPADRKWLTVIGILAGFAYGCKMTAAPAVVFGMLYVAWVLWRSRTWSWRALITTAAIALVFIAPWLIKNTLMVGNPFSPFLNRYFPNPYVRISFEDEYREQFKTYYGTVPKASMIPLEVTVQGAKLNGLLGPLFLLAPLGLLALRWPLGRRAWIAAAFLLTTYPGNIGTRFLIPALPFVSIALALLFEQWRVGVAAVMFQFLIAWPSVTETYSDKYSWRLDRLRWAAAWRIEPEDKFVERMMPSTRMSKLVNLMVPPDGRVFTFGGIAESYTSRDVDTAYQGGQNNMAGEILAAGIAPDLPTVVSSTFRFGAVHAKRVRLVQTSSTPQVWSIGELRVLSPGGTDYKREQWWRLRASPNPWNVQLAFDDCPVTRWKAWQPSTPGEFLEIDFIKPVEVGGIRAETSADQPAVKMRVEVDLGDGRWKPLESQPEVAGMELPPNARVIAVDDLKRLGYTHLIVDKNEFLAQDIYRNEAAWGLTRLGDTGEARLYKLN